MKVNKQKKILKKSDFDEVEKLKQKKKLPSNDQKINLKSLKFWNEVYDDEGDELEKFIK